MTDETRPDQAAAPAGPEGTDPADNPLTAALSDQIVKLDAENSELKDRVLRTLAEMENLRRRTEKEIKDARDYAITAFARDLLAVADNLVRAVSAVPAEMREATEGGVKALVDGVDMTGRELARVLEKHGVKKLEPMGARFDPNLHQAMFEIPNGDVATGTVLQVLQDGFQIGDRVLRPALVGVAKGGPKAAPAVAADGSGATVDRTV